MVLVPYTGRITRHRGLLPVVIGSGDRIGGHDPHDTSTRRCLVLILLDLGLLLLHPGVVQDLICMSWLTLYCIVLYGRQRLEGPGWLEGEESSSYFIVPIVVIVTTTIAATNTAASLTTTAASSTTTTGSRTTITSTGTTASLATTIAGGGRCTLMRDTTGSFPPVVGRLAGCFPCLFVEDRAGVLYLTVDRF